MTSLYVWDKLKHFSNYTILPLVKCQRINGINFDWFETILIDSDQVNSDQFRSDQFWSGWKMIMKYHELTCINHEGLDQILLILFISYWRKNTYIGWVDNYILIDFAFFINVRWDNKYSFINLRHCCFPRNH